ncbi:MAG: HAD hydrolase-like protein [Clostridiales bacterium]|nr:HAD hydrolase-like protein [Clostridiales bacterium]
MKRLLPKAISFDIYGTIIDWDGGTIDWYRRFFEKYHITNLSPVEIESAWEKLQFEYIRNYRPFRQVLKDTFIKTAWYYGFPYDESDVESFASEMEKMKAFPDAKKAIDDIRAMGIKTCALSNVDNDIISESFRHEGIVMDAIVTAEDVKCYKPHYPGFLKSQEVMGCTADEMHHAAFGFKYDAVPGNALGYTTVWIKRSDMQRDAIDKEDLMFGDLISYSIYLRGLKAIDEENGIVY